MYKILITTSTNSNILKMIIQECVLNKKLSPCAHIINNVNSFYIWDDNLVNENESILMIKCKKSNADAIKRIINEKHNYKVPEIISFDFDIISSKYKRWFNEIK